jgi:hypothetical protein
MKDARVSIQGLYHDQAAITQRFHFFEVSSFRWTAYPFFRGTGAHFTAE